MSKTFNSFNDLLKEIQNIIDEEVNGVISFEQLFDLGFMDRNSKFSSFKEFLDNYKFDVYKIEDFENIDLGTLNKAIAESTKFSSWEEMYFQAGHEYAYKKLTDEGLDIIVE